MIVYACMCSLWKCAKKVLSMEVYYVDVLCAGQLTASMWNMGRHYIFM